MRRSDIQRILKKEYGRWLLTPMSDIEGYSWKMGHFSNSTALQFDTIIGYKGAFATPLEAANEAFKYAKQELKKKRKKVKK